MSRKRSDGQAQAIQAGKKVCNKWVDLGEGVGQACMDCGMAKPRADEAWPGCPGKVVVNAAELKLRRSMSLPAQLLAWGWARMAKTLGDGVDPGWLQANKAAARQPFAGLNLAQFQREFRQTAEVAKQVYQALPADTDPREHTLACCAALLYLAQDGYVSTVNGGVLQATAILEEAQRGGASWPWKPDNLKPLAERIIKKARDLGYFGGRGRAEDQITLH